LDRYFQAASPTSIERNIYSVQVPSDAHSEAIKNPNAFTDAAVASYYSASFSPEAGFCLLSYEGPGVPYQKVIKIGDEGGSNVRPRMLGTHSRWGCIANARLLVANEGLNKTVQMYEGPTLIHSTIESDGYGEEAIGAPIPGCLPFAGHTELNVVEMRPPNMDDSGKTKYPVLFHL
jgi:dipeptidyl aminopeptidase